MGNASEIRTAATRLFASHGFEGASLQAIAERVGVTKQTLLYHYPSKDALRRAVLGQLFEHWRERLPQMLEAVTSGHRRFEALTRELISFFQSDPDRARLLIRELLDNPEDMRRLLLENLRPWILLVAQYIREGQRIELINEDVDPEAYVLNAILLVIACIASQPVLVAALGSDAESVEATQQRLLAEITRLTRTGLFRP